MAVKLDFNYTWVDWWQERDRTSIVAYANAARDVILGEWWDDDAQQMIEDGFFKWKDDASVLDYLEEMGIAEHVSEDD